MSNVLTYIFGNRTRTFFYYHLSNTIWTFLLLWITSYQPGSIYYKLLLSGLIISLFFTFFWWAIYTNKAFSVTVAQSILYVDVFVVWAIIYPAGYGNLLFLILPLLSLLSGIFYIYAKRIPYFLAAFTLLFTLSHFFYSFLLSTKNPLKTFVAETILFGIVGGVTYTTVRAWIEVNKKRQILEKERKELLKKAQALQYKLQVSKQESKILHKDVRRRDIEIQNILNLSDQLKSRNDAREVIISFLLTVIGQIGSSHAAVFTREKKEHNYLKIFAQKGLRGQEVEKLRIYLDSNLIELLRAIGEPMLIQQIPRETLFSDEVNLLNRFNDDLICPIFIRQRITGIFIIGQKINGLQFERSDINLVSILANQAAFVLEQTQMANDYRDFYSKTMRAMLQSLEARYTYARGHNVRTANYVNLVSRKLGLSAQEINEFSYGALLHDIGKVVVQDKYLLNADRFSAKDESIKEKILLHTIEGSKILKAAGFNETITDLALHHHEFFNGKGFPHHLGENDLSLGSRILGVCNAFDAMVSDRPYRQPLSIEEAKENIRIQSGKQFDPEVVHAFLDELSQNPGMLKYN